jgi:hypothetical protein
LWIGTGGSAARVFRSVDRGRHWSVSRTPLQQGAASKGVFGVLFWNYRDGIVVGGDYTQEGDPSQSIARTADGGLTWNADDLTPPGGFRSAVVSFQDQGGIVLVTVGPSGSDLSLDAGETWSQIEGPGFHAVSATADGTVWAVGAEGRIGRLSLSRATSTPDR